VRGFTSLGFGSRPGGFRLDRLGVVGVIFRIWRNRSLCVLWTALALAVCPLTAQGWESVVAESDRALAAGDFDRAEDLLTQAAAQARAFGEDDPRHAQSLLKLARLYRAEGDYAKPENLYQEARESGAVAWGRESGEYAQLLNEIGRYYHTRRKYDLAEGYYLDAFGIRVRTFGKEHVDVADSINNLAVLFENQARYAKAEMYFRTALAIREQLLGPDALPTVETKEHFARLLLRMQKGEEAEPLLEQARAVRRPMLDKLTADRVDLGEVVSAGPGVRTPELELQVDPEYSDEARIARQEGSVALEIEMDSEGVPRNFRVLRPLGLGLDEKAIEAVRQWRFKPARLNGKRVPFRAVLQISFRLL